MVVSDHNSKTVFEIYSLRCPVVFSVSCFGFKLFNIKKHLNSVSNRILGAILFALNIVTQLHLTRLVGDGHKHQKKYTLKTISPVHNTKIF